MKAIRPIASGRHQKVQLPSNVEDELLKCRREILRQIGRGFTLDEAMRCLVPKRPGSERLYAVARDRVELELAKKGKL
jgi:hypothetical protein